MSMTLEHVGKFFDTLHGLTINDRLTWAWNDEVSSVSSTFGVLHFNLTTIDDTLTITENQQFLFRLRGLDLPFDQFEKYEKLKFEAMCQDGRAGLDKTLKRVIVALQ